MFWDSLICSFRNLGRKKFRSFLTISGISVGVASVVLIGSIGEIGKNTINQELQSLGLGSITVSADRKFTSQKMTEDDLTLIRENPNVKSATPIVMDYSNVRMRGLVANSVLWGTDRGENQIISLTPQYGRLLTQADVSSAAEVCVVDSNVANLFYKRENIVGKFLDAMIGGSYVRLKIVGVASSGGNLLQSMVGDVIPSFIYLPYTTLQRYAGEASFDQIAVTMVDSKNVEAMSEQIAAAINRQHNISRGFKADNISRQKETLDRVLGIITVVLSAIAAVSLVVAGLGIMTVMIVSVNERTREIGIKKSIGATQSTILVEFLIEAFTISLMGSMIGVIVGVLLTAAGCLAISIPALINFRLIGISIGISVVVGIVFGVYPAMMAARLHPVNALRIEY